jgi:hypothetical protein
MMQPRRARRTMLRLLPGLLPALFATAPASAEGRLAFYANGEELATEGFVDGRATVDGWTLRFEHVYVTLTEVVAHQAEPPYDAHAGGEIAATATARLDGVVTVDLVQGDESGRVRVGEVATAPGHYNALTWRMVPATSGPAEGSSILFVGTAERDGETVAFTLASGETHHYRCGEFVGDERKGFLQAGGTADVELTFHLDHVFGRSDVDADDPMNAEAPGFDRFAAGGAQELSLRGLHIGHVGEGHCHVDGE